MSYFSIQLMSRTTFNFLKDWALLELVDYINIMIAREKTAEANVYKKERTENRCSWEKKTQLGSEKP